MNGETVREWCAKNNPQIAEDKPALTLNQREAIRMVCRNCINSGQAYAYGHESGGKPIYDEEQALEEIVRILEGRQ